MMQPHISIIVCTYNRKEMLTKALECMIHQESNGQFSFDIVVIDDGSKDGTGHMVEEIVARSKVHIRYFFIDGEGISHARNRGIAESNGEWIAFFDQDQLAEPNWLRELFVAAFQSCGEVVYGPRDLALSQEQLSWISPICRRALGEIMDGLELRKCIGRTVACTGNVLISRRVFNAVGDFDESILEGWEDWDFFRRVKSAGFDIWYAPKALVHHLIPPERITEHFFEWHSFRVGICFAHRDYREWGLFKTVLASIARIGQALMVNLPLLFWAYLRGKNAEALGRKCLLLRAAAYTRRTLSLLAPRIFPQKRFFTQLEFRKEREFFPKYLTGNSNQ